MAGSSSERPSRVVRQSAAYAKTAKKLGLRIRELRLSQDLTLEAAAERMEVDLKHLQKIEAATVNVTLVTLVRIAAGLNVELASLFSTSDASTKSTRGSKR